MKTVTRKFGYTDLLQNGFETVQSQQSMPRKTVTYISKFE